MGVLLWSLGVVWNTSIFVRFPRLDALPYQYHSYNKEVCFSFKKIEIDLIYYLYRIKREYSWVTFWWTRQKDWENPQLIAIYCLGDVKVNYIYLLDHALYLWRDVESVLFFGFSMPVTLLYPSHFYWSIASSTIQATTPLMQNTEQSRENDR